jgi:hypothetical protein
LGNLSFSSAGLETSPAVLSSSDYSSYFLQRVLKGTTSFNPEKKSDLLSRYFYWRTLVV